MTPLFAAWLLAGAAFAQEAQSSEATDLWLGDAMVDGVVSDGLGEDLDDGLGGPSDAVFEGVAEGDDFAAAASLDAWRADPLDLNGATLEELAELPGMTRALATVVRHARPLHSLAEFVRLGELPAGLAESLLPLVRVGTAPARASRWGASAGAAWRAGGAPAPVFELAGAHDPGWDLHAQASVLPQAGAPGSLERSSGRSGRRSAGAPGRGESTSRRRSGEWGGWGPGWPLGSVQLQPQAAHARGQWGHVAGVVGDFTAGFAEGITLERSPRRALAGWTLRAPPRFSLPRGRWATPSGWQGAAVSWSASQLTLTALGGVAPQPWGGGAVQIRWLEGLQTTLVGYGTGTPKDPGKNSGAVPSHAGLGWASGASTEPDAVPSRAGLGRASGASTEPDAVPSRAGLGRASGAPRGGAAAGVSRGALGLGLRARYGAWELAGEGSHGLPAGWGWHLGGAWQVAAPLQLGLRWRGATADFGHVYQRGGLRAAWPVRAGTQAQAQLRWGAWRSSTRLALDLPRWRLAEGVGWAPTFWEHLRVGASLRPAPPPRAGHRSRRASASHGAPAVASSERAGSQPLQWSAHALASSRRVLRLPMSLALRASPRALRTTARLRWQVLEDTALGLALTAATQLPRARGMEGALALDVRQRWDKWDVVVRAWTGCAARWEHAALLVVAAHY